MIVPFEKLSTAALRSLLEEFVTCDGTDSRYIKKTLEQNVAKLKRQLELGQTFIVYDEKAQTCNIVSKKHLEKKGKV